MDRATELFTRLLEGGEGRVAEMIANAESEELFLDYKRSADNGAGARLAPEDKRSLAKAISGFGNSEGGVILWGVDCRADPQRGDVPSAEVPIQNATRFKSLLEQAVSGCTIPPHNQVAHAVLLKAGGPAGFVATLIARGMHPPYQTVPDLKYLMRSGSNFAPVPHAVLAGMFGRQPQPLVHIQFVTTNAAVDGPVVRLNVGLALRNAGMGVASDVYLNAFLAGAGGENSELSIEPGDQERWDHTFALGRLWSSMLKSDYRVAPEGLVLPASLRISLRPPFVHPFNVTVSAGSAGSPPAKAKLNTPAAELDALYNQFIQAGPEQRRVAETALMDRLLRVPA